MNEENDIDFDILTKIKLEWMLLFVIFSLILYFSAIFDDGKLIHEVPVNLNAGDMFVTSAFGDVARFSDDMKKVPPEFAGGATDALNFFSPLHGIILAELASFVNAETYDFLIHLNLLTLIGAIFVMYFIIKKFDTNAALVSLLIFPLVFKWPFNFIITWGGTYGNLNIFIAITTLLCFYRLNKSHMFIILGIVNASSFLSHGREFQTANLAFATILLFWIIKDKAYKKILEKPKEIIKLFSIEPSLIILKRYIWSIPITILFMFPWWSVLRVFKETNLGIGIIRWGYNPLFHQVTFSSLGIFSYLIFLSIIMSLIYLYNQKYNEFDSFLIFSLIFFICGIIIIAGNNIPQARAFYVITALPMLCLLFCNIIGKITEVTNLSKNIITTVLFITFLMVVLLLHKPESIGNSSLISPERMASFNWIKENIKDNSTILATYGDEYNQRSVFAVIRKPYNIINQEDYFNAIKKEKLTSNYKIDKWVIHEKFIFDDKEGRIIAAPDEFIPVEESICNYTYVYADKYSQNKILTTYNGLLIDALLKEADFEIIYENQLIVILKNKKIGGKCFLDKTL